MHILALIVIKRWSGIYFKANLGSECSASRTTAIRWYQITVWEQVFFVNLVRPNEKIRLLMSQVSWNVPTCWWSCLEGVILPTQYMTWKKFDTLFMAFSQILNFRKQTLWRAFVETLIELNDGKEACFSEDLSAKTIRYLWSTWPKSMPYLLTKRLKTILYTKREYPRVIFKSGSCSIYTHAINTEWLLKLEHFSEIQC